MEIERVSGHRSLATLGKPTTWARDLAVVGGITSFVAPMALAGPIGVAGALLSYSAAAGVAGAVTGAILGALMPRFLGRMREVSIPVLLFGGMGVGGLWGAIVGTIAPLSLGDGLMFSVLGASVAGALQFGWFWLPYLTRLIAKKRTWPLTVGAAVLAPVLGWISFLMVGMTLGFFGF